MKHTINLDDELSRDLLQRAELEDRSLNNLVTRILREYMIREKGNPPSQSTKWQKLVDKTQFDEERSEEK